MTKKEFIASFVSPLPNAIMKKFPNGNIRQYWAENPSLYSTAFGKHDDFSEHVCGHSGIDVATFHRDVVVAAHDGIVSRIKTTRDTLGGLQVHIQSRVFTNLNGKYVYAETVYAHLDQYVVKKGQKVSAGQLIGYMGNTGFVVSGNTQYWGNAPAGIGTHLHFGYKEFYADSDIPVSKNCMQNTMDPLPMILNKNPDYSGTAVLLANVASWLRSIKL